MCLAKLKEQLNLPIKMKIIFMGTPKFSTPFLQKIIDMPNSEISAVFTQKPKKQGRGMNIKKSEVHQLAEKYNIKVYTPSTLKNQEIYDCINSIEADVIIVVAYGFILPMKILNMKKYGCINVHPSLLPKYRGAAPMQHTIINGDTKTSVCIMKMDAGMDTGDIIIQEKFDIAHDITYEELEEKASNIGTKLLEHTINNIDNITYTKQSKEGVTIAPKIDKKESKINWNEHAFKISCKVRALSSSIGMFFNYQDTRIKVLEVQYIDKDHYEVFEPGEVIDNNLTIACGYNSVLKILKIQKAGKKPVTVTEFLRGNSIAKGTKL